MKFTTEDRILLEYGIEHPIVADEVIQAIVNLLADYDSLRERARTTVRTCNCDTGPRSDYRFHNSWCNSKGD